MAYGCKQREQSFVFLLNYLLSILFVLSATCFIEGYTHSDHHCNHQHPKADEVRSKCYFVFFFVCCY